MPKNLADLFALLEKLFVGVSLNLPAFLTFVNTVMNAWHGLPDILGDHPTAGALKMKMIPSQLTTAEVDQANGFIAAVGGTNVGGLDGHRVAQIGKWLLAHEGQIAAILGMFGVQIPVLPAPAAK